MATSQPTYPTYPNTQTTSNPCSCSYTDTQSSSQPMHDRIRLIVRRLILALIFLFVGITAVSFISWLILQPQLPVVRVDSLSVSNFNLSDLQTNARYKVEFTIMNPDTKISLEFKRFLVSVSYDRSPLSRGWLGRALEVRKMNESGVKIELGSNPGDNSWITTRTTIEIGSDWRERREVSLNVGMVGLAQFEVSDWLNRHSSISVSCENLRVAFSSNDTSSMTGKLRGTSDCSVYLL
ncbi:hypothetical protein CsSME_00046721 [Camellia sinensis var. sinensis]